MTADDALLHRARSGDGQAFAELVGPHRRELHVHCYRMLGSFDDADDAVQETLLAAWRGLATFQGKASMRTWLYRVATNTCLNLLRTATRRPQMALTLPPASPAPTGSEKVTWLQPYPDALLDGLPDDDLGPDVRVEQNEAVSLAFITALQLLSPRARAVLILRDVLGFSARDVGDTLHSTEEAVAMTLSRARASLRGQAHPPGPSPNRRPGRRGDAGAPPGRRLHRARHRHGREPARRGRADRHATAARRLGGPPRAAEFLAEVAFRLVPEARFVETRANRQPALAVYTRDDTNGLWHGSGLLVITVRGEQVAGLTRFESHTLRAFGLPRVLPDSDPT